MSVFQFKIKYSDEKDIIRIVEIKSDQTFEQLHNLLLSSYGLKGKQLASFYMCDEEWNKMDEITLLDMSDDETKIPVMSKTKVSDFVLTVGQKLIYVFDFQDMWEFFIELIAIKDKVEAKIKYPLIVNSIGTLPKKNKSQNKNQLPVKNSEKSELIETESETFENDGLEEGYNEDMLFGVEDPEGDRLTEEDEF